MHPRTDLVFALGLFAGAASVAGAPPAFALRETPRVLGYGWTEARPALADVNGDGWPDLVVESGIEIDGQPRRQVMAFLNRADGTFAPGVPTVTGSATDAELHNGALATGDFDGDGLADVVLSRAFPAGYGAHENLTVLFSGAGGRFVRAKAVATSLSPNINTMAVRAGAIGVADVNRDGLLDIVTTTVQGRLSTLLGNGRGGFSAPIITGKALTYDALLIGDINGDSIPDVVTVFDSGSTSTADTIVDVNVGLGDGQFWYMATAHLDCRFQRTDTSTARAALLPLPRAGKACIVVFGESGADEDNGGLYVLRCDQWGELATTFRETRSHDSSRAQGIVLADVNGDRIVDVIKIPAPGAGEEEVLVNDGRGGLTRRAVFPALVFRAVAAEATDVVGSGYPDVLLIETPALPASALAPTLLHVLQNEVPGSCPADMNADGVVSQEDLTIFVSRWLAELMADPITPGRLGDVNGDGRVDGADVAVFLQTWFAALESNCGAGP